VTDDDLVRLLRAAVPPVVVETPARDMWPGLVERIENREPWAWFDIGLAVALAFVLSAFPEWLPLLAYHF
jgi:hypothetical protein